MCPAWLGVRVIRHFFSVLNFHQLSFIGFAAALSANFSAAVHQWVDTKLWLKVKNSSCGWFVETEGAGSIQVSKDRLVAACLEPGGSVSKLAQEHGLMRTSFAKGGGRTPRRIRYRRLRHLRLSLFRSPPRAGSSTLRCLPRRAKSNCRRRRRAIR